MDVTPVDGRIVGTWTGDVKVYKCDPPFRWSDWEDDENETEYVIISAVNNGWAHEAYIFPCNKDGVTSSMIELPGSYQGGTDHQQAIDGLKAYAERYGISNVRE